MASKLSKADLIKKFDELGFPYRVDSADMMLVCARQSSSSNGDEPWRKRAVVVEVLNQDKYHFFLGWYAPDEIDAACDNVKNRSGVQSVTILNSTIIK